MGFFTTTTTIINNSPRLIFSFFFIFFILSSHSLFSICNAFESEVGNLSLSLSLLYMYLSGYMYIQKCYEPPLSTLMLCLVGGVGRDLEREMEKVEDETPFTYVEGTGKGPRKWGKVNPHWKSCGNGKLQSPIDVVDQRVKVFPNLGKLKKDYKPAPATLKNRGHDIAVEWKGDAGKININGTRYKLLQCHWHSPSEHTFNGTRYHLELHIVHLSSCGTIAVVGIVYKYGQPDPFLAKVRTVSRDQVQALRDAVHDGFEANARPIQQLDGRTIFLYNPGVSARSI
ncbi:hypothetical protein TEA_000338 [Camellia sinensis var. sinensis]|uniref:Alpha-carbonic anhydrase domain-containing protein n=1 Tax=Camellia sinensis var. sinensis TaxID=542762 RepID=A0A4S4E2V8_CAMSN|nr:hypothetical protein TEA_000338 [Camellia sinensis var. sinensis]